MQTIHKHHPFSEKPGLVVRAEGSRSRGGGFESRSVMNGSTQCYLLHLQPSFWEIMKTFLSRLFWDRFFFGGGAGGRDGGRSFGDLESR
jgi:hypothetical protein